MVEQILDAVGKRGRSAPLAVFVLALVACDGGTSSNRHEIEFSYDAGTPVEERLRTSSTTVADGRRVLEAEHASAIPSTATNYGWGVSINGGDCLKYTVDVGPSGWAGSFAAFGATPAARRIEVRLGASNGPVMAALTTVANGGDYSGPYVESEATLQLRPSDVVDLYVCGVGLPGIGNFDYFELRSGNADCATHVGTRWAMASRGQVPANAVRAFVSTPVSPAVCRASYNGARSTGFVGPNGCRIPVPNGAYIEPHAYEVLLSSNTNLVRWRPKSALVRSASVLGGSGGMSPKYICRATFDEGWLVGTLTSDGCQVGSPPGAPAQTRNSTQYDVLEYDLGARRMGDVVETDAVGELTQERGIATWRLLPRLYYTRQSVVVTVEGLSEASTRVVTGMMRMDLAAMRTLHAAQRAGTVDALTEGQLLASLMTLEFWYADGTAVPSHVDLSIRDASFDRALLDPRTRTDAQLQRYLGLNERLWLELFYESNLDESCESVGGSTGRRALSLSCSDAKQNFFRELRRALMFATAGGVSAYMIASFLAKALLAAALGPVAIAALVATAAVAVIVAVAPAIKAWRECENPTAPPAPPEEPFFDPPPTPEPPPERRTNPELDVGCVNFEVINGRARCLQEPNDPKIPDCPPNTYHGENGSCHQLVRTQTQNCARRQGFDNNPVRTPERAVVYDVDAREAVDECPATVSVEMDGGECCFGREGRAPQTIEIDGEQRCCPANFRDDPLALPELSPLGFLRTDAADTALATINVRPGDQLIATGTTLEIRRTDSSGFSARTVSLTLTPREIERFSHWLGRDLMLNRLGQIPIYVGVDRVVMLNSAVPSGWTLTQPFARDGGPGRIAERPFCSDGGNNECPGDCATPSVSCRRGSCVAGRCEYSAIANCPPPSTSTAICSGAEFEVGDGSAITVSCGGLLVRRKTYARSGTGAFDPRGNLQYECADNSFTDQEPCFRSAGVWVAPGDELVVECTPPLHEYYVFGSNPPVYAKTGNCILRVTRNGSVVGSVNVGVYTPERTPLSSNETCFAFTHERATLQLLANPSCSQGCCG